MSGMTRLAGACPLDGMVRLTAPLEAACGAGGHCLAEGTARLAHARTGRLSVLGLILHWQVGPEARSYAAIGEPELCHGLDLVPKPTSATIPLGTALRALAPVSGPPKDGQPAPRTVV